MGEREREAYPSDVSLGARAREPAPPPRLPRRGGAPRSAASRRRERESVRAPVRIIEEREGRMVVATPGGRVTRRPRGVSGERELEPVVTYRARDPESHTLRALARSGPWAGERRWRADERGSHGGTRTDSDTPEPGRRRPS